MDTLAEFALAFPQWIGPDGYPLSWRHYVQGMAHLSRHHARTAIRAAGPARIAQADKKDFQDWYREQSRNAGWN